MEKRYMKKHICLFLLVISVVIVSMGCNRKSTPTEEKIKEDIMKYQKDYLDNSLYLDIEFDNLLGSAQIGRDMYITELKIQKSRTDNDSYTAWCDVTFLDDSYRDTCVVVVCYNKYDGNYWEFKEMYEEDDTRKSEVLAQLPEEAIHKLISDVFDLSGTSSYELIEIREEKLENNICKIKACIENAKGLQGDIKGFPLEEILNGYSMPVRAEAEMVFEYDGIHAWYMSQITSEYPDIENIKDSCEDALIKSARFILNGDKNIDSLYLSNTRSDEEFYYFEINGTGGNVILCEKYIPELMKFQYVGLDVSGWNYQWGKKTEGNALFFDPGDYLIPHL